MCKYSERLIAWMDGELGESEAAEIEQHVRACPACGKCVSACEEICHEFAAYYAAFTQTRPVLPSRKVFRWVPEAAAIAAVAAMLAIAFIPRFTKPLSSTPPALTATAPNVSESKTPVMQAAANRDAVVHPKMAEPEFPQGLKPSAYGVPSGTAKSRALTRGMNGTGSSAKTNFAMAEPAIQIALPAEAMFPPGAVPEGVTYIANVSLGPGGSVQGIQLATSN